MVREPASKLPRVSYSLSSAVNRVQSVAAGAKKTRVENQKIVDSDCDDHAAETAETAIATGGKGELEEGDDLPAARMVVHAHRALQLNSRQLTADLL